MNYSEFKKIKPGDYVYSVVLKNSHDHFVRSFRVVETYPPPQHSSSVGDVIVADGGLKVSIYCEELFSEKRLAILHAISRNEFECDSIDAIIESHNNEIKKLNKKKEIIKRLIRSHQSELPK